MQKHYNNIGLLQRYMLLINGKHFPPFKVAILYRCVGVCDHVCMY